MGKSVILNDCLRPGLDFAFCGSAVGSRSDQLGAYYAGPGNRFWSTLADTGITPRRFDPTEYRLLLDHRCGLTDLVKSKSGNDNVLMKSDFGRDELHMKIMKYQPRVLAFTGKRAARAFLGRRVDYGLQEDRIGNTRIYVLPSPSGAARRWWDAKRWRDLARMKSKP